MSQALGEEFIVVINSGSVVKPRKGSFVVTLDGVKEPIIELLAMPRPFTKLRAMEVDEMVASIHAAK